MTRPDLGTWIEALLQDPQQLGMGHNQRAEDQNLGLGWLYYGFARLVRPAHAVVIGSYRGFVPLVIARALTDNVENGRVTFIDPSLVDDHWSDPESVRAFFARHGLDNVEHYALTTQAFRESDAHAALPPIGLLFVDGYHSAEQARFDYETFQPLLEPHGMALFHDSMVSRESRIYGQDETYRTSVPEFIDELRKDPELQVLDVPFGPGLSLVFRAGLAPRLEGFAGRIREER